MSSPADLPPTEAHVKAETLPLGELLSDLTRDVSTLMRQEVELAKVELKESATKAGKGAGMLAGAAWAGHITVLFLSIALWWALGQLVGLGWSAVIVAVIWGIIAAVLAVMGRKELNAIKGLPRTAETVKEIPPALKPNTEETR
ncbi:phage holin family protein [Paenarthrobacter sp. NPDC057355]|uniref:phage holin family protein n=1 Tax=unclassified Paenarthrobacter TaxID=2634190 RepID=UPI0021C872A8|nr:phage holin family protein [Paenarthrobacter sp. JL.01a]UXM91872.1 phage holin family protein [Paenarthrobacter sp. JL.01a]